MDDFFATTFCTVEVGDEGIEGISFPSAEKKKSKIVPKTVSYV